MSKDTELFELCKEVHEKTGWKTGGLGDRFWVFQPYKDKRRRELCEKYKLMTFEQVNEMYGARSIDDDSESFIPLYTSDYLLEKLPPVVQDSYDKKFRHIQMWINGDGEARACYVEPYDKEFRGAYAAKSDSMLKALLKLTIALSEAGELDNDQSS